MLWWHYKAISSFFALVPYFCSDVSMWLYVLTNLTSKFWIQLRIRLGAHRGLNLRVFLIKYTGLIILSLKWAFVLIWLLVKLIHYYFPLDFFEVRDRLCVVQNLILSSASHTIIDDLWPCYVYRHVEFRHSKLQSRLLSSFPLFKGYILACFLPESLLYWTSFLGLEVVNQVLTLCIISLLFVLISTLLLIYWSSSHRTLLFCWFVQVFCSSALMSRSVSILWLHLLSDLLHI